MTMSLLQDSVRAPSVTGSSAVLDTVGVRLVDLPTGATAQVLSVIAGTADNGCGGAELGRRLAELGFLPGERVRIVARGFLGREPIAVRIGTGTFALRAYEAACVRVSPEFSQSR
jgi:ferrous iron transport protein A